MEKTEWILKQCSLYPGLQPEDLLKGLYQSVFGCEHAAENPEEGIIRLRMELKRGFPNDGPEVEPLAGDFCRVHLRYLNHYGMRPETLQRLFSLSSEKRCGSAEELDVALAQLLGLAEAGQLPFSADKIRTAVDVWKKSGALPCHHSEIFREKYRPAYRVLRNDLPLQLFSAIDTLCLEKQRVLVAIEGGSASGKTTLASWLQRVYDCPVFHMDDFFLRPEQRTERRIQEPGGNVDYERFRAEVLLPLRMGHPVQLRRYDCHTQKLSAAETVDPGRLSIIEGVYSMHPTLKAAYDLTVFLKISPELQRKRILYRNGNKIAEQFFSQWIPLEKRYFQEFNPEAQSNLVL